MKLTKKVNVRGYEGDLPIYLVDDLSESTGGEKKCQLYISLAALDNDNKLAGQSPLIIVVSSKFLKFSRKNQLALLTYYNQLPIQEKYDFLTQKGPELAAKTEVIAEHGKFRFKRAFKKLDKKERRCVAKSAGRKLHSDFKKLKKEEKALIKAIDGDMIKDNVFSHSDFFRSEEEEEIDLVKYFESNLDRACEITSYKGAKVTPIASGVPYESEYSKKVYEGDVIDEDGTVVETDVAASVTTV